MPTRLLAQLFRSSDINQVFTIGPNLTGSMTDYVKKNLILLKISYQSILITHHQLFQFQCNHTARLVV